MNNVWRALLGGSSSRQQNLTLVFKALIVGKADAVEEHVEQTDPGSKLDYQGPDGEDGRGEQYSLE